MTEHKPAPDVENIKVQREVKMQNGDNCYLMKGENTLMSSFPNESSYEGAEIKALLNFGCRMTSKYLALGGTWDVVAKQAEGSGVGHRTIVSEIHKMVVGNAEIVREVSI